jgi:hypothetical protein
MATKATVQTEIENVREEIRVHEVAIWELKQKLSDLKLNLPKSKMAQAEEIFVGNEDKPRAEIIKLFSNRLGLSVQVASLYYSTVKGRVARRRRAEQESE